jgi:hypothetical protein
MPQPVKSMLEQLHTSFPELQESAELEEGIASTIGRGVGNIGRGITGAVRGIGNVATNAAAGFKGISDEEISSLIQAFENPQAVIKSTTVATEEPQEGKQLDITNVQDTQQYFDDVVRRLLDHKDPAVLTAIKKLAQAVGGTLDYSKWNWASLNELNKLGTQTFPDWKPRELPQEAELNKTPIVDAQEEQGAAS